MIKQSKIVTPFIRKGFFLLIPCLLMLLAACGSATPTTTGSSAAPTATSSSNGTGYGKYGSAPTPTATATTAAATPAPTTPASDGGNKVDVANFAFSPASMTVKVGTKVTWTNSDSVTHTVTSDTGAFNSNDLAPGSSFSFTFAKAGTYAYHCNIHTSMMATIIVQ